MDVARLPVPVWRQLVDLIPLATVVADAAGRLVTCNRAYRELFGLGDDLDAAHDVTAIARPGDHDWTRRNLDRLATAGASGNGPVPDRLETECTCTRADGSTFAARLTGRPLRSADGPQFLVVTIVPIDARASGRVAPIARLLEFASDTLTLVDADGRVKETTGRYVDVLGYPPEFWESRTVFDLVDAEDAATAMRLRDELLSTPFGEIETDMEVRAADGSRQLIQVRAYNGLDDPELDGVVMVTRNVTEQRRMMRELAHGRSRAEAVAEARTTLLAAVSHELRNPLHAVLGMAELLAADDLAPAASDIARSLHRQLVHLSGIAEDLLDAARLDAGRIHLEPAPVRVSEIVADVLAVGHGSAAAPVVVVEGRCRDDVPEWIEADPTRLRQVLSNLVGNAAKFTEVGRVHLDVSVDRPRPDGDGDGDGDARIVFTVADTGIGIPIDEVDHVLEPFASASTGGPRRGTGLGLTIADRLVDAMHGSMSVRSRVGEGTEVVVSIPLRAVDAPSHDPVPGARSEPSGIRVLVVEDDPVNRHLARLQFERLDMEPVVTCSGEDAWALLTSPDPGFDAVLIDEQLPGWSGTETVRRMRRAGGRLAVMPVVGLTADGSVAQREACLAAGMNVVLTKPASMRDLCEAILAAIDTGRAPGGVDADNVRVPSPDGPNASPVDAAVLERLATELGDDGAVRGLVTTYLSELPARLDAITTRLATDPGPAARAAHALGSASRLLGAIELAETCQAIERGGAPVCPSEVARSAGRTADALIVWAAWRS